MADVRGHELWRCPRLIEVVAGVCQCFQRDTAAVSASSFDQALISKYTRGLDAAAAAVTSTRSLCPCLHMNVCRGSKRFGTQPPAERLAASIIAAASSEGFICEETPGSRSAWPPLSGASGHLSGVCRARLCHMLLHAPASGAWQKGHPVETCTCCYE